MDGRRQEFVPGCFERNYWAGVTWSTVDRAMVVYLSLGGRKELAELKAGKGMRVERILSVR